MSSIDGVLTLLGYNHDSKLGDFKARFRGDRRPANIGATTRGAPPRHAGLLASLKIRPSRLQAVHAGSPRQALETGLLDVSSPWRPSRRPPSRRPLLGLFTLFSIPSSSSYHMHPVKRASSPATSTRTFAHKLHFNIVLHLV
ncbi:hypothetical protein ISCGN_031610 [Ixodes scapularis]